MNYGIMAMLVVVIIVMFNDRNAYEKCMERYSEGACLEKLR